MGKLSTEQKIYKLENKELLKSIWKIYQKNNGNLTVNNLNDFFHKEELSKDVSMLIVEILNLDGLISDDVLNSFEKEEVTTLDDEDYMIFQEELNQEEINLLKENSKRIRINKKELISSKNYKIISKYLEESYFKLPEELFSFEDIIHLLSNIMSLLGEKEEDRALDYIMMWWNKL